MTGSFSPEFIQKAREWCAEGEDRSDRSLGAYIEKHWSEADYDKWIAYRFGGATFHCRFCGVDIKHPGMCSICEEAQDRPSAPIHERLTAFGVPSEMAGCGWNNWVEPQIKNKSLHDECARSIALIREWQGKPPLLMLSGIPGIGKTHMAVATLARRIKAKGGAGVTWLRYPKICEMLKNGETITKNPLKDTLRDRRLLVIDDFGQGYTTAWMGLEIFAVICDRIDNGRPTIITTNLIPRDIEEISSALRSRLHASLVLKSNGMEDWRMK